MKKKIRMVFLLLVFAVGTLTLVSCGKSESVEPEPELEQTTEQDTTSQETSLQDTTLKILIPVTTYDDMDVFTEAYNADGNKYTIDLQKCDDASMVDPLQYDALIIPGGKHVHPSNYNTEVLCNKHGFDEDLDQLELLLFDKFMKANKPILGICRGSQLINVALGGTLNQDIGQEHYKGKTRITNTVEGTDMRNLYGESLTSLHYHHQAVDQLADGLTVTMVDAADGVIEGYTHDTLPIYGVQFHPEKMYVKDDPTLKENGLKYMNFFFDICYSMK